MTAAEVCSRIREVGILPGIRVPSAEDALFAASEMYRCGIPIVELTMTVPGALNILKELRAPFPGVPFIAAGGVTQHTAGEFIRKGATALGIRGELIPPDAVERRDHNWISELAARFLIIIRRTREEFGLA